MSNRTKKARLVALTPEAQRALGDEAILIEHYPFRFGRESRGERRHNGDYYDGNRRESVSVRPNNDIYLHDPAHRKNISREHMQIDVAEDGGFLVYERGSACGTVVGNQRLGGHRMRQHCPVEDGNVIVVGTSASPYVFRFEVLDEES